jgi:HlyD family secretion protein
MANQSNKKTFIILGVLLVAFVAGGILARTMGWLGDESGTLVETGNSERRTLTQMVSASGVISPEVEVIISPDVSGEIIELTVKEGDFVNQGDLLLRIRPDIYQARIDEIQGALLNSKAREQQAYAIMLRSKLNFEKQKELYEKNLIPEMEYITAKTQFDADEANYNASRYSVQSTEASLRQAQEELRKTVIRAPISGTISKLNVETGERVVGSVQMTGTEILRIARLEQMEVSVRVNENDIIKVSVGDTTRILVDSYSGRNFRGIVTEIANSATRRGEGTTEQVSEYVVKIRITTPHNLGSSPQLMQLAASDEGQSADPAPDFKPGMSASVDIETHTEYNVIAVPIQAVTVRDFASLASSRGDSTDVEVQEKDDAQEGVTDTSRVRREDIRRVVFIVDGDKATMVEVETGINDDSHIQILRGLDEGTEIVTGNYRLLSRQLKDGDKIRKN